MLAVVNGDRWPRSGSLAPRMKLWACAFALQAQGPRRGCEGAKR